jgi:hypothetical protein
MRFQGPPFRRRAFNFRSNRGARGTVKAILSDMSAATESMRWNLMQSVERCYYVGPVAGQRWLGTLSSFIQVLPRNDRRLIRLAILGSSPDLGDFIALHPPTPADQLHPSAWLDEYVDWAAELPALRR